jgi:hypothetical protein
VVREAATGVGQKLGDLLIAELGKHFDLSIVTRDEVVEGVSRRWSSGSVRPGA